MTLPGSPTYLVSGDVDICPTDKILRDQGRHVRHDTDVELEASQVLQLGETFVVVAHGSRTGNRFMGTVRYKRRRTMAVGWHAGSPNRGSPLLIFLPCGKKARAVSKGLRFFRPRRRRAHAR